MRRRVPALVLLLAIASAGCGVPTTRYYMLELQPSAATANPTGSRGINVGVQTFRVDSPYDGDSIVYRVGENSPQINFYPYDRWAAPLSRMLPRFVAVGLTGATGLSSIEPVVPGHDYDFMLYGRVLAVEEVDTSGGQRVSVRIALELRAEQETLWSHLLEAESTTQTERVEDLVRLMGTSLGRALEAARADLGQAVGAVTGP